MAAAIEVRSISKQFKLYHEHYTSLKERVIHYGRIPYEPFLGTIATSPETFSRSDGKPQSAAMEPWRTTFVDNDEGSITAGRSRPPPRRRTGSP